MALVGYGISLLPEWEAQVDAILNELAGVYGNLNAVFAGYADGQGTPAAQAMLRAEAERWQAEQVERGLNPAAPLADVAERLRIAQEEMGRQNTPLALPVQYQADAELPGFRIVPTTPDAPPLRDADPPCLHTAADRAQKLSGGLPVGG